MSDPIETNGTSRSRATISRAESFKLRDWMEENRATLIELTIPQLAVKIGERLGRDVTDGIATGMRSDLEWPPRRSGKEDDALQLRLRLDDLEARVAKLEGKEPTFEPHEHER